MRHKSIYILWDGSHIWGIMAWRAMRAFDVPCRLVKSKEIAQGALLGKSLLESPAALLAPGGSGRLKSRALGARGRAALREWIRLGGVYLGFCGGAGLALQAAHEEDGLGICPWSRGEYPQRFLHLLSGHVWGGGENLEPLELPIWWPGRFAPNNSPDVRILARIIEPSSDLWLADLPLARMPPHVLESLREDGILDARLSFLARQPLVISGKYGHGSYLLSYAHLETPQSTNANAWLASLLKDFCGIEVKNRHTRPWDYESMYDRPDPGSLESGYELTMTRCLALACHRMNALMNMGVELGLFFRRASWLFGWRAGLGGMACNNLLAGLSTLASLAPSQAAQAFWMDRDREFRGLFDAFIKQAEALWWSWRLNRTMGSSQRDSENRQKNDRERARIFGHPMLGGGLAQELLDLIEDLIWLSQENAD